ncbi:carbamoyltransferase [Candidatus Margulisiibacteriota bacterium]
MNILSISAFYHDSAAALLRDGEIIAAAQEERFTRKKHDSGFPINAIQYCLEEGQLKIDDVDYITFYEKPFIKFERLLFSYLTTAPYGLRSFIKAIPIWMKKKLWLPQLINKELEPTKKIPILFIEHHDAHAASAFYPSPFDESAVLTMDGVGEWATSSIGKGSGKELKLLKELHFPHSLGLLYSSFTYYTGFKVNSGEYKVMGLAPYGEGKYTKKILTELIDLKKDGSFTLNMEYFDFVGGLKMTNKKFNKLFGGKPRKPESLITQREMDLARSVQEAVEEIMLRMANHAHKLTGSKNLCLAGGVALNCVGNGRILREGPFKNVWIQPAAGDAGGSIGAALAAWHQVLDNERKVTEKQDSQKGSYLGPEFSEHQIETYLRKNQIKYKKYSDKQFLLKDLASILKDEKVVGWFNGRMEFGPRALGARSIIGDARSEKMQKVMNLKIKYRESFRPFAPSVLAEDVADYFELNSASPYMLLVAPIKKELRKKMTPEQEKLFGIEKLNVKRSDMPAITHVDYSARVQTVHKETNPDFYGLLSEFKALTGSAVLVNTSFNVRGEPIVCTPEDAYRCFMRTEMDYLVLENFLLDKKDQQKLKKDVDWKKQFALD